MIDVLESEKNENEEGDFDDVFDIWQDPLDLFSLWYWDFLCTFISFF